MKNKKIINILAVVILLWNTTVYSCTLHTYGPVIPPEHYKDTYYFEYMVGESKSFIYIATATDFIWIENPFSIFGLYMMDYEEIESIEQEEVEKNKVIIKMKDGSEKIINTEKQEEEEDNVLIGKIENDTLYLDIKPEYEYLYEESYYNEKVEQTIEKYGKSKKIDYKLASELTKNNVDHKLKTTTMDKNNDQLKYMMTAVVVVGIVIVMLIVKLKGSKNEY